MRLPQVSRRLGMFAGALLVCGVTLVGSTGAGMMASQATNPINHMVVRPHHENNNNNNHNNHNNHNNNNHNNHNNHNSHNNHNNHSSSHTSSSSSSSSVNAVVLPLTGSDPGSNRLP